MDRIVVFGNGVFAELMCFNLKHDSPYDVVAFTVDSRYIKAKTVLGLPVVPFESVETVFPPAGHGMIVPISFQRLNFLRAAKYAEAKRKGYQLVNYVSSRAITSVDLKIGDNCVILENAVVAPFVEIGSDVIIASSAIVGHHSTVRNHCFISPAAVILGGATIDEYSLIGANATVKEEVTVCRECLIGSGVSISSDTREKGVYLNQPPRLQRRRSDELRSWLTWPVRAGSSSVEG